MFAVHELIEYVIIQSLNTNLIKQLIVVIRSWQDTLSYLWKKGSESKVQSDQQTTEVHTYLITSSFTEIHKPFSLQVAVVVTVSARWLQRCKSLFVILSHFLDARIDSFSISLKCLFFFSDPAAGKKKDKKWVHKPYAYPTINSSPSGPLDLPRPDGGGGYWYLPPSNSAPGPRSDTRKRH